MNNICFATPDYGRHLYLIINNYIINFIQIYTIMFSRCAGWLCFTAYQLFLVIYTKNSADTYIWMRSWCNGYVVGNGHGQPSSNPGQDCLAFTYH